MMKLLISSMLGLTLIVMVSLTVAHPKQATSVAVDQVDSVALVALYNSTNGPNWKQKWDLQEPVKKWYGVTLDGSGKKVVDLALSDNGLDGLLPEAIGRLEGLVRLRLPKNSLKGNLPDSLVYLVNLRELILYDNQFQGALPDSIHKMTSLVMVSMTNNLLDKPLPNSLGQLHNLEVLILSNNFIEGPLPNTLAGMQSLRTLTLSNNRITGPLPVSLGQLPSLRECLLDNNRIDGKVPYSIAQLSNLQYLWLDHNRLSDTFPTINLPKLVSLRIQNNALRRIPDFTLLSSIYQKAPNGINAAHNQLSFEDLLPNLPLADSARFDFSPLDSIDITDTIYVSVGDRFTYSLPFDDTLTTNTYTWFHYDKKKEISRVNELFIPAVQYIDGGNYRCRITNRILDTVVVITRAFTLIVKGNGGCGNPPAADECYLADIQCALNNLDQYCAKTDSDRSPEIFSFCGKVFSIQDRDWFAFTAGASSARIRVTPFSCTDRTQGGIVAYVFDDCSLGTPLNCDTNCTRSTIELQLDHLTVGKEYYLLIGSCSNSCYYQINVIDGGQGVQLEDPGILSGPDSICQHSLFYTYTLDTPIDGVEKYEWQTAGEEPVYTLLPKLNTQWSTPGAKVLCVRGIGSCDTTESACLDIQVFTELTYDRLKVEKVTGNTFYYVEFRISGGIPPYVISGSGGTYNAVDRTFTSELIACGMPYDISVEDGNHCRFEVAGTEYCSCTSDAGTLQGDTIIACEGSAFKVFHNNNAALDSNDIGVFIWYEKFEAGNFRNIVEINDDGVFHYNAQSVMTGKPYRVQYVVANQTSNGGIDWQDPCLDTTRAVIAIYQKRPEAFAGDDTTVCFGNFRLRANPLPPGSTGRWRFVGGPDTPKIENQRDPHSLVRVIAPGSYHFFWVQQLGSCVDGDTVQIKVKPPLDLQVDGARALCTGRQTILRILKPYLHYQWSTSDTTNKITITQPGFYGVTVTDSIGCTASQTVEVKDKQSPQPIITGRNEACVGDTLPFKVKQPYLSYRWSNGDVGPIAQVYQGGILCVTVTDVDGCEGEDCMEITFHPPSTIFQSVDLCSGDSLVIDGTAYRDSGHYEVVLHTPNRYGCDSTLVVDINTLPKITLEDTLIVHDDGRHQGLINAIIAGGRKPYTYQWNTGQTTPFIKNLSAGRYELTVTDANRCTATFTFTIVDLTSNANPPGAEGLELKMYPSIVHEGGEAYLAYRSDQQLHMRIYLRALQGQTLYEMEVRTNSKWKIHALPTNMPKGVYLVSASQQGRILRTWRWVVL